MKARLSIVLLMLLAGTATRAGVTVSHSRSVDFSTLRTYAWADGTPAHSPQLEKFIREAVDFELQARGLTKAAGPSDLTVVTHASSRAETREDVDILGRPAAVTESGGQWADPNLREMEMGRLVVELADGASGLQVWRAAATEIFDVDPDKAPKRARKRVLRLVGKMFKDFPPRD